MKHKKKLIAGIVLLLLISVVNCENLFTCMFGKDTWNTKDWTLVKSPRWDYVGNWIQGDNYIENQTPRDITKKQMFDERASETYTSMVFNKKMTLNSYVESTMEFSDRMAPLIVIAPDISKDGQNRPEYREHFEVVLYDKGINVWHHTFVDNKPSWKKAAWFALSLKAKQKYKMKIELKRTHHDKIMIIFIDDKQVGGYIENSLPDTFYVGITGCEGINRFYDFTIGKL